MLHTPRAPRRPTAHAGAPHTPYTPHTAAHAWPNARPRTPTARRLTTACAAVADDARVAERMVTVDSTTHPDEHKESRLAALPGLVVSDERAMFRRLCEDWIKGEPFYVNLPIECVTSMEVMGVVRDETELVMLLGANLALCAHLTLVVLRGSKEHDGIFARVQTQKPDVAMRLQDVVPYEDCVCIDLRTPGRFGCAHVAAGRMDPFLRKELDANHEQEARRRASDADAEPRAMEAAYAQFDEAYTKRTSFNASFNVNIVDCYKHVAPYLGKRKKPWHDKCLVMLRIAKMHLRRIGNIPIILVLDKSKDPKEYAAIVKICGEFAEDGPPIAVHSVEWCPVAACPLNGIDATHSCLLVDLRSLPTCCHMTFRHVDVPVVAGNIVLSVRS